MIYKDKYINNKSFIREFIYKKKEINEYQWHRDENDRIVTILDIKGLWYYQEDNKLPIELKVGMIIEISNEIWHRIIPIDGKTESIKIKIDE